MDNNKLLNMIENQNVKDEDAVGMIIGNFINIGGNLVGLTVDNAIKAVALLREYERRKRDYNNVIEDILIVKKCEACNEHLTLMASCRGDDTTQESYFVERCMVCGQHPVTEIVRLSENQKDLYK